MLCLHRDRVRSSKRSPRCSGDQSDCTSLPPSRFLHTVLQPNPPNPGKSLHCLTVCLHSQFTPPPAHHLSFLTHVRILWIFT